MNQLSYNVSRKKLKIKDLNSKDQSTKILKHINLFKNIN